MNVVRIVLVLILSGVARADPCGPVDTDAGPVLGTFEDDVHVFRGVPYAQPPVGELRWRPPQPPTPWTEPRTCDAFGPACPQHPSEVFRNQDPPERLDEDCLYLNVWTPSLRPEARLPVLVWIHGGGNQNGYSHQPWYFGDRLAAQGVVVVTINYRLGAFGYFAHPLLSEESERGVSGNYGLLDQVRALEWVRDNVLQFGGDPDCVTIFGESAGGVNCTALMLSPLARGLFHRVIAQSNTVLMSRRYLDRSLPEVPSAHEDGRATARRLLRSEATPTLEALRALSAETILERSRSVQGLIGRNAGDSDRFQVTIDGYVLPDAPEDLLQRGEFAQVPLLIGCNADDASLFTTQVRFRRVQGYRWTLQQLFPDVHARVFELYPAETPQQANQAFSRILTDAIFLHDTRRFADLVAAQGVPVFYYLFARVPPFARLAGLGAFHALEIGYAFETHERTAGRPGLFNAQDRALAQVMSSYWRTFAREGDPNASEAVAWPVYEAETARYLRLDATVTAGEQLRQEAYEVFRGARRP